MTWTLLRPMASSALLRSALLCGAAFVTACGAFDAQDPTRVNDEDLNNGSGAELFRKGMYEPFARALSEVGYAGGVLSDEFRIDPSPVSLSSGQVIPRYLLDRRASVAYENAVSGATTPYALLQDARRVTTLAIPRMRAYFAEPQRSAYLQQAYALRGYVTLTLAENFCSGLPLHTLNGYEIVYGPPRSTAEIFERALADFDTALTYGTDSIRFTDLARLGRGRTLLGLGRFAEAGSAVASVPDDFQASLEMGNFDNGVSLPSLLSTFFRYFASGGTRTSIANHDGANGLDFIAADDPRLAKGFMGIAWNGVDSLFRIGDIQENSPITYGSGREARLIEAEAALQAGQPQWLTILNALRADANLGLDDLEDPITPALREDLLFRERAFWLYATAHRLGDLRRLVAYYNRSVESVFPTGPYPTGNAYDIATSIPFPGALEAAYNPAVTGCTTR